jgi:hypothetical protein
LRNLLNRSAWGLQMTAGQLTLFHQYCYGFYHMALSRVIGRWGISHQRHLPLENSRW